MKRLAAAGMIAVATAGPASCAIVRSAAAGLPQILEAGPEVLSEALASGEPVPGPVLAGTESGRICLSGPYAMPDEESDAFVAALEDDGFHFTNEGEVVVAHWAEPVLRTSPFQRSRLELVAAMAEAPAGAVQCADTAAARLHVTDAGLYLSATLQ